MIVLLLVILQQVVQGLLELLEILLLRLIFQIPLLRRLCLFPRIRDANYRFRESEKMQLILLSVIVLVRFGLLVGKQQRVSREWE